jgi:cytochrome c oxidase subunit 4
MATPVSHREERRVEAIRPSRYWIVWILLLVLTAVTVVVGRIHLEHGWGLVVAMVIAIAKASLVALFFMHLWDHGGANRLVLVTGLFFLGLLLGITLLDNATRFPLTNPPTEGNMKYQPPGPDILSPAMPGASPQGRHGAEGRDQAGPREHGRQEPSREAAQ